MHLAAAVRAQLLDCSPGPDTCPAPCLQEEGNYKAAHAQLLATCRQLQQLGTRPPGEVMRALLLLHSYVLVKSLLALNDHEGAARMLVGRKASLRISCSHAS